jgi:hypothetical protein
MNAKTCRCLFNVIYPALLISNHKHQRFISVPSSNCKMTYIAHLSIGITIHQPAPGQYAAKMRPAGFCGTNWGGPQAPAE